MLMGISSSTGIPLSTLKSSAKTLKLLGLMDYGNGSVELTGLAKALLLLMNSDAKR